jgi:hypothetical protein
VDPRCPRPVRKIGRGRIARQSARSPQSREACGPGTRPNLVADLESGAPCTGPASRDSCAMDSLPAPFAFVPLRRLGQPAATGRY